MSWVEKIEKKLFSGGGTSIRHQRVLKFAREISFRYEINIFIM